MSSMLVVKCLVSTDKYKEGVSYVIRSEIAERLIAVLPDCFELEDTTEDPYETGATEVD